VVGGLVQQQQVGLFGQGACDGEALAPAARKRDGAGVEIGEAGLSKRDLTWACRSASSAAAMGALATTVQTVSSSPNVDSWGT
jgi:hypothetical protein